MSGAPGQGWAWTSIPTGAVSWEVSGSLSQAETYFIIFFFLLVDEMQTSGGCDGDVFV